MITAVDDGMRRSRRWRYDLLPGLAFPRAGEWDAIDLISVTFIIGLEGVSIRIPFVFFLMESSTFSRFVVSTKVASNPKSLKISSNNLYVPPYKSSDKIM